MLDNFFSGVIGILVFPIVLILCIGLGFSNVMILDFFFNMIGLDFFSIYKIVSTAIFSFLWLILFIFIRLRSEKFNKETIPLLFKNEENKV